MAKAKTETESENVEREPVTPSELDELTHAEMLELYRASSEATRFAKHQQWGTLLGTLILFVLLGVIGDNAYKGTFLFKLVIIISLVLSAGAIYSLIIYQFWQNAEREKLAVVTSYLSNLTRSVRDMVTERERNVHRYVLLFFMVASIGLGNWLLIAYLAPKL
jgi:CDP-diglyceride synthetase